MTRTTNELKTGDMFASRYRIQKKIGKGGMGTVYKAVDTVLEVPVALKTINVDITNDERTVKRLKREVVLARKVAHPHACRIYDIGEAEGVHYVSMEYVEGSTLADILKERGKLNPLEGVVIIKQVLMALQEAHRAGVIHRDLKPQNIMVDVNNRAFIMDFGISISEDAHRLTETGMLIGTPRYMAPEQFGNRNVDHRADLYSIGIIMFEMFTGRLPFEANTPAAVMFAHLYTTPPNPSVFVSGFPPALDSVIARVLDKEPQNRYAGAQELIQALETVERQLEKAISDGTTESFAPDEQETVSAASIPSPPQAPAGDSRQTVAHGMPERPVGVQDAVQPTIPQVQRESSRVFLIAGVAIAAIAIAGILFFVGSFSGNDQPDTALTKNGVTDSQPATVDTQDAKGPNASGPGADVPPTQTGTDVSQPGQDVSGGQSKAPAEVPTTPSETQQQPKRILVQSQPPGAAIFVNGRDTGQKTPGYVNVAPGDEHNVELRLAGYEPSRKRIDQNSPEQLPLRMVAIPLAPGKVAYEGTLPVSIYDGKSLVLNTKQGSTVELQAGTYTFTLISREKAVIRDVRTVQVKSGETTVLKEPVMGKLTITANPSNCKIMIDSDYQDAAPIFNLPVQAGTHSIKLEWSRLGKEKSFSIDIPAGETRIVRALASDQEVEVVEEKSR